MGLLIFFAIISITFSFLCSIWEAVLLSITPSYINIEKQKGSQIGKDLERFKEDIDQPLSAILTLNTIAHTVGAIMVGAQAAVAFPSEEPLFKIENLGIHIGTESIIATVMTLAILILSEIIPKTLGANFWKQLAPFTIRSLKVLIMLLWPLVWISQLITKRFKKEKGKNVFARTDFLAMTQAGEESGALAASETTIIKNLLRFEKIPVKAIMTPRTVATMVEASTTIKDFYESQEKIRFSRIPVYEKDIDEVVGLILKDELLEQMIKGNGDSPVSKIKKDILAVNPEKKLPEVLDALTQARSHLAMVVDDFGSLAGVVSMEDVFETLLGLEIVDEMDAVADLQELARAKWEERARKLGIIE